MPWAEIIYVEGTKNSTPVYVSEGALSKEGHGSPTEETNTKKNYLPLSPAQIGARVGSDVLGLANGLRHLQILSSLHEFLDLSHFWVWSMFVLGDQLVTFVWPSTQEVSKSRG